MFFCCSTEGRRAFSQDTERCALMLFLVIPLLGLYPNGVKVLSVMIMWFVLQPPTALLHEPGHESQLFGGSWPRVPILARLSCLPDVQVHIQRKVSDTYIAVKDLLGVDICKTFRSLHCIHLRAGSDS